MTCADCHKSQKRISEGWSENATVCVKCHQQVEKTYKGSIHSKNGATHCVDCHNPHRIKSYKELNADERVAVCSRCHKDYLRKHGWLPNTSLHFEYLECATCHSPRSEKSMVFYFARKTAGKKIPLSYDQLIALYGSDPAAVIKERQGIVSPDTQDRSALHDPGSAGQGPCHRRIHHRHPGASRLFTDQAQGEGVRYLPLRRSALL